MTNKYNRLYTVMKMLSFPSSLTVAPMKFVKIEDDVLPVIYMGKHYQILSLIFAVIISSIYLKEKVYDALQMGKDFFLYIRSLSTFIEIICLVGNMLCHSFGARKTVRLYKKMKKIIKYNFSEADYKSMNKLFLLELLTPTLLLIPQFYIYCYILAGPDMILFFILDSNITVLLTAISLRHYNIAVVFKICIEKLLKSLKGTVDLKQLQQVWSSYLEIHGVVKGSNEFFGLGLSCSLAVLYVYCLIALFGICAFISTFPQRAANNIFWFCVEMCRILPIVIGTCMCEVNARELRARLGYCDGEDDHFEEANNVRCKLIGSKIKFNAYGFFDTDASLLYKLIGGLLLNLIILMQFGKKFHD